jgi:hypothetical protein
MLFRRFLKKYAEQKKRNERLALVFATFSMFAYGGMLSAQISNAEIETGRQFFYRGVESAAAVDSGLTHFKSLEATTSRDSALLFVYRGALLALKGKHAFWPLSKTDYVNRGLDLLDRAVAIAPDSPEVVFVRASTTYYVPFFFYRQEQAQRDLLHLFSLLQVSSTSGGRFRLPILTFIRSNADLTAGQIVRIDSMRSRLESGQPGNGNGN